MRTSRSRGRRVCSAPSRSSSRSCSARSSATAGESWAHTPERAAGEAEIERRAAAYGLPPVVWPEGWPLTSLAAMRAATHAKREGLQREFARAVYEREFAHGEDISSVDALERIGASVGLHGIREAVADPAIKQALREATDEAWAAGVQGVPTLRAGDRLLFGDDRLEEARG